MNDYNIYAVWMYLSRSKLPSKYQNMEIFKFADTSVNIEDLQHLDERDLLCLTENAHREIATRSSNLIAFYAKKFGVDETIVKAADDLRNAALHVVSSSGSINLAKQLLAHGANVNAANILIATPLHIAAFAGHLKLVKLYLDKGANIGAIDHQGSTPLHFAARANRLGVVNVLLQQGAKVDSKDICGQTALFEAVRGGCSAVVPTLLKYQADTNSVDNSGNTTLHYAVRTTPEVVLQLLEKGAELNVVNKSKETPLKIAAEGFQLEIIRLLVNRGAKFDQQDINCSTCAQCYEIKKAIINIEERLKREAKEKKDDGLLPKKRDVHAVLCEECKELRKFMEGKLNEQQSDKNTWEDKEQARRALYSNSVEKI